MMPIFHSSVVYFAEKHLHCWMPRRIFGCAARHSNASYRFTTYQDVRRVRLVDGLKQIFYEYHPLITHRVDSRCHCQSYNSSGWASARLIGGWCIELKQEKLASKIERSDDKKKKKKKTNDTNVSPNNPHPLIEHVPVLPGMVESLSKEILKE